MIINLNRDNGSMAHHLIFNSVDMDTIEEIVNKEGYDANNVSLELFVNGVKCDISKFIDVLSQSLNEECDKLEQTRKMTREQLLNDLKVDKNKELEEELERIMDSLYDFKNRADEIIDKLYK